MFQNLASVVLLTIAFVVPVAQDQVVTMNAVNMSTSGAGGVLA